MALIERLQAYRAGLLKAGKLLEARAVARCIAIVRQKTADLTHKIDL